MDTLFYAPTDCSYNVSDYELSQPLLCNGNLVSSIDASINDLSQIFAPAVQIYPVCEYASSNLGLVPVYYNTAMNLQNQVPTGTIVAIVNNTDASMNIVTSGYYPGPTAALYLGPSTCSVFMSIGYISNFTNPSTPNVNDGLTTWVNLVANQTVIGGSLGFDPTTS